ncbi:MAG: hypothetical protein LRY73_09640 [Bacillus sp. (in: Bacteria)]|nr:hypothetical protein [Bacillus sp. (in: firmicutes)]
MKIKMKKSELVTKDDIWNAVVSVMGETDFPTDNEVANEAYLVFQYYSEMESGGHESLLNWWSEYIEEVGAANYLKELTAILEKNRCKELREDF